MDIYAHVENDINGSVYKYAPVSKHSVEGKSACKIDTYANNIRFYNDDFTCKSHWSKHISKSTQHFYRFTENQRTGHICKCKHVKTYNSSHISYYSATSLLCARCYIYAKDIEKGVEYLKYYVTQKISKCDDNNKKFFIFPKQKYCHNFNNKLIHTEDSSNRLPQPRSINYPYLNTQHNNQPPMFIRQHSHLQKDDGNKNLSLSLRSLIPIEAQQISISNNPDKESFPVFVK